MKQNFKIFTYWILATVITCFVIANVPISYFNLTKYFVKNKLGSTVTALSSTDILSDFPNLFNTTINTLNTDKLENNSYTSRLTIGSTTIGTLITGFITSTSTATSTFAGGLTMVGMSSTKGINVTTGTSTFANGLNITGGCIYFNSTCLGATTVTSVSNSDTTLTISPTTGNVVASLNLGKSNVWSAIQSFGYSGTTTASGGFYASLVSAPYFNATSTTATSSLTALRVSGTATTTNMVVSGTCVNCATNGYEVNTSTCNLNGGSPSSCTVTLTCTTGKYVISGGHDGISALAAGSNYKIDSYPDTTDPAKATWKVDAGGPNGGTDTITGYSICVNR